ncbi:MAG: SIS domain-containing protein [Polyangiaceae bacterium]|nr:SIS domain-containing protein [Polyangiaceae bacterium]
MLVTAARALEPEPAAAAPPGSLREAVLVALDSSARLRTAPPPPEPATHLEVLALDVDGVLTDGRLTLRDGGGAGKRLSYRDLDACTRARTAGVRVALVTGEEGAAVERIAHLVKPELVLEGRKDKLAALHELGARLGVGLDRICYVGDSDRDAPALAAVALGLAPVDASVEARRAAHRTLSSPGGRGAVQEAVELVLAEREPRAERDAAERAVRRIAHASLEAHRRFADEAPAEIARLACALAGALRRGGKVLLCGNGGSAADAQHVAGELLCRFLRDREPWPAIALGADTPALTAIANDYRYEDVFARQIRALARAGDVVVGITTSGSSPNILAALDAGRERGATTIAFTGERGAPLAERADLCFVAPARDTARVQELHLAAWHAICEVVESLLTAGAAE